MKVTLVFPCLRNFGGFNSLGKHVESCFIIHGLPSLAASLQQQGHIVNLLDLRERASWLDVESWVRSNDAEVYGIYMSTLDYHEAKRTAEIIKRLKPTAKVLVGGPHPSIVPESLVPDTCFDYIFAGEGEITFPQMLRDFDAYPRVVYGEHPDLNQLPYEDREIFNLKKAFSVPHPTYLSPFVNVISGRGCPYNCVPGDTEIITPFGNIEIEELVYNPLPVLSCKGNQQKNSQVLSTQQFKNKKLIHIETHNGKELKTTPDHLVWTKRGWIEAQHLQDSDEVLLNE